MSTPEQRYSADEESPPPPYQPRTDVNIDTQEAGIHLKTSKPSPPDVSPPPYPEPGTATFSLLIAPEPPPYQPPTDRTTRQRNEDEVFSEWQ